MLYFLSVMKDPSLHTDFNARQWKGAAASLHHLILWTTTTFWNCPFNVLVRHLDTAALAVDAVLSIDDQLLFVVALLVHVFVDSRWTKSLFGTTEFGQGFTLWNLCKLGFDAKMTRLIFFMVSITSLQIGQQVKGQFTIGSWIVSFGVLVRRFRRISVSNRMIQCPRFLSFGNMCCKS